MRKHRCAAMLGHRECNDDAARRPATEPLPDRKRESRAGGMARLCSCPKGRPSPSAGRTLRMWIVLPSHVPRAVEGLTVPIRDILKVEYGPVFEPEEVASLTAAFDAALSKLGLVDRKAQ